MMSSMVTLLQVRRARMLEHQKSKRDDLVTLARRSVMVQLVLVKPVMTGINKRHLPVRVDI